MPEHAPKRMTYAEYLEADDASEVKLEFVDGQAVAMTGGSIAHVVVIGNVHHELRKALDSRGCRVFVSDARLWIPAFEQSRYPDAMVVCGDIVYDDDDDPQALLNPTVIVEVVSPSTEGRDRGDKAAEFRTLPSVQQIVFINPRSRRIEVLTRADEAWVLHDVPSAGPLELSSIDVRIELAELWRGVPPARPAT